MADEDTLRMLLPGDPNLHQLKALYGQLLSMSSASSSPCPYHAFMHLCKICMAKCTQKSGSDEAVQTANEESVHEHVDLLVDLFVESGLGTENLVHVLWTLDQYTVSDQNASSSSFYSAWLSSLVQVFMERGLLPLSECMRYLEPSLLLSIDCIPSMALFQKKLVRINTDIQ